MAFLGDKEIKDLKDIFSNLKDPVQIVHFTQKLNCQYCPQTLELLKEVAALDDRIELKVLNAQIDKEAAKKYMVTEMPATIIQCQEDLGIRFYGIPGGYEFSVLIDTLLMVSNNKQDLSEKTMERLSHVTSPVMIKVFVTPSCPYCSRASLLAYKFAMANKNITGVVYEASEYPHLVQRYQVMGVPKIIINEDIELEGALPESAMRKQILAAAEKTGSTIPAEKKQECKPGDVCEITDDTFDKKVLLANEPVVVDFWAEWCGPCRLLAPTMKKLAEQYKGKVSVYKLNTEENPKIPGKYNIMSIPTVMIFSQSEAQDILIGLRPIKEYQKILDKLLTGK